MMRRSLLLLVLASLLPAASAAACAASSSGSSPIDGHWTFTWTRAGFRRVGATPIDPNSLLGPWTCIWRGGRFVCHNSASGRTEHGTFRIRGAIAFIVITSRNTGDHPGQVREMRFSVYRDRLTWSKVPGSVGIDPLPSAPWTRVA